MGRDGDQDVRMEWRNRTGSDRWTVSLEVMSKYMILSRCQVTECGVLTFVLVVVALAVVAVVRLEVRGLAEALGAAGTCGTTNRRFDQILMLMQKSIKRASLCTM
jgi:hypothetical protein